jgi:hypothetical protein
MFYSPLSLFGFGWYHDNFIASFEHEFDSVHVDSSGVTMMMHESLCSLWFSHRRGDESLKLNMTLILSVILDY